MTRPRRPYYSKPYYKLPGPTDNELLANFGLAAHKVRSLFLKLPEESLEAILQDFARIHGAGPARYARNTIPKWRSGETKVSGLTMERLVALVPPYLSAEERFDLLRQILRARNSKATQNHSIFVNRDAPAAGLAQLQAALNSLKSDAELARLPESLMKAVNWLYADDITVGRAMFAQADRQESEAVRESAARELALLLRTVNSGQVKEASYSVTMPAGHLQVRIGKPARSHCFVATVCYGETAWQTKTLRRWRDESLKQHPGGRAFVLWYYRHGPAMARLVLACPALRRAVTGGIGAVAWLVWKGRQWHNAPSTQPHR